MMLKFRKMARNAITPTRGSAHAVGYDLCACDHETLMPGQRSLILTGIAVAIPEGCYGRVAPRSGLANRFGADVLAGVIDPDYRGEVGVILINHGARDIIINPGDRIAQLILERCEVVQVVEVSDLDSTDRGAGGFGSTGV